ncbi:mucoidy inhibitor MuiA family protein [Tamlana sp. 2_MG-2023]|uniref:mucoidy inhibitor MuiA family protein n=1 Tax=unclassified Tamlana TaxID=2614803 RepID=UPI0026E2C34A|nr:MULTISPECIES: mucoidy inhibitor MuiA family protein [unclassified Tamlana]MDO6761166.1 mucoidy inhibitor MuiA family protein [Tamlana sp. 2_MG-2023]MDO6791501.1 mucoidy inhibitor MuiA family protein [Tamlana sp. 1_MG-2023]
MKYPITIILCLVFSFSFSQEITEKKVSSKIEEVTVFINGAQILRKKSVDLKPGTTMINFTNLSPFIESKSVQVKANSNITVLSVNHQQNFIDKLDKQQELIDLEASLEKNQNLLTLEKTHLDILKEELNFLQENRQIGGKNQELSVTNLKEASNFYSTKLTDLKLKEIERHQTISKLEEKQSDIQNQINSMTSKKKYANGEILVKVESKKTTKVEFEISYVVSNAGWLPTYDIRAKNVNEPIELVYKANVKQDTKIDWKNVKLRLSSANPNLSGVAPELKTYYLNYNTAPPRYNRDINQVSGQVLDENSRPIPGVNVIIKGSTIGTTTDFDGNYALTIPETSTQLEFSYLGYENKIINITDAIHNVRLVESMEALDEVVIVGYGTRKRKSVSRDLKGTVSGVSVDNSIPVVQTENQTTVNFEIDLPYSILSDNKSYSVDMVKYNLPADYQYYSVPKIENEAFLIASIQNWEQYNLLEGEANIFFEGTYVGKTILDVRYASDSLQISLGRDKNVIVSREKISDYASKKLIGSKKEENRDWRITVKNNKSQSINMLIMDQIPVSNNDEIKVESFELSNGKQDPNTGEIRWEFSLEPNKSKIIDLKYAVKYPRNKTLIIE